MCCVFFLFFLCNSELQVSLQNVAKSPKPGAFTGELCAPMVKDFGLEWVRYLCCTSIIPESSYCTVPMSRHSPGWCCCCGGGGLFTYFGGDCCGSCSRGATVRYVCLLLLFAFDAFRLPRWFLWARLVHCVR